MSNNDSSYFSPQTPLPSPMDMATSSTTTTTTTTMTPTGPVITATVTSRNNESKAYQIQPPPHPYYHLQPHPPSDRLQQFALHIPNAPVKLSLPIRSTASSSSSSSSASSSSSPLPQPYASGPIHAGTMTHPPQNTSVTASSPSASSRFGSSGHTTPLDRTNGTPMPQSSVASLMTIQSYQSKHTLSVHLPLTILPEMVTISANKGDRLRVVADAWHMEHESRYEWQISFPPHDVDISAVQAKFDPDGRLTIDVRRRAKMFY